MLILATHSPINHRKCFILASSWKDHYVFIAETFLFFAAPSPICVFTLQYPVFRWNEAAEVWGGAYKWLSKLHNSFSTSLSSPGWDSCSWYLISRTVIFLQGKIDACICQVSGLWDRSWEISPSVRTLPEGCSPLGVDGGCKMVSVSRTVGLHLLAPDVTA